MLKLNKNRSVATLSKTTRKTKQNKKSKDKFQIKYNNSSCVIW